MIEYDLKGTRAHKSLKFRIYFICLFVNVYDIKVQQILNAVYLPLKTMALQNG